MFPAWIAGPVSPKIETALGKTAGVSCVDVSMMRETVTLGLNDDDADTRNTVTQTLNMLCYPSTGNIQAGCWWETVPLFVTQIMIALWITAIIMVLATMQMTTVFCAVLRPGHPKMTKSPLRSCVL